MTLCLVFDSESTPHPSPLPTGERGKGSRSSSLSTLSSTQIFQVDAALRTTRSVPSPLWGEGDREQIFKPFNFEFDSDLSGRCRSKNNLVSPPLPTGERGKGSRSSSLSTLSSTQIFQVDAALRTTRSAPSTLLGEGEREQIFKPFNPEFDSDLSGRCSSKNNLVSPLYPLGRGGKRADLQTFQP